MPFTQKKILIIDDDPDLCVLLSKFLEKNGYAVDTAYSGSKGIEKIKVERAVHTFHEFPYIIGRCIPVFSHNKSIFIY